MVNNPTYTGSKRIKTFKNVVTELQNHPVSTLDQSPHVSCPSFVCCVLSIEGSLPSIISHNNQIKREKNIDVSKY